MANRTINTSGMMENVNKYVKKIIANKRTVVDVIKANTISSAKQSLKK